jgi:multidrug efflux pump subunit AcrA (membrane-fusion protein)
VRAQIVFGTPEGLTVPLVSALRINGQFFVFLAENGPNGTVARQRAVTLGRIVGNEYVVESGLKAGERLIVSGIQKIGEGAPVSPVAAATGDAGAPGNGRGASTEPSGGRGQ